jgi:proton glutamate symport protein
MSGPTNTSKALSPSSARRLLTRLEYLLEKRLWAQILVAMAAGITLGLLLSPSGGAVVSEATANLVATWLALPGRLFLALIQMVVVPLVLSSIVLGIATSGDTDFLKRIGYRIAPYFISTTVMAVLIGATIALWIAPGQYLGDSLLAAVTSEVAMLDGSIVETSTFSAQTLPEKIIEIIPANPTYAILSRSMFQIVILAIFIAVALASIAPSRAKPIVDLCVSLQDISMKVVSWAMALAPAAVFGLLAQVCVQVGFDAIVGVGAYMGTVLFGLLLLLGFYLLVVMTVGKRNPITFVKAIWGVQLLAFSTSSSAAVMPLSMKTAEETLGVSRPISQFIVPLGATVNMDGTALYQVVAAVFLTQVYGIDLTLAELILLSVTTVGASIGSPSTPGVGIVILATIVQGIGVPAEGIALILGVDRLLDMTRTAVNVSGDLTACVVMDHWLDDVNPSERSS